MITPLPPQKTGESAYAAKLIGGLEATRKIRIVVLSGPDAYPIESKDGAVKTLRVWQGRSITYPLKIARELKVCKVHMVHVQFGPHGAVYGGLFGEPMLLLLLLAKFLGIRTTVTFHSTWMTAQVAERIRQYKRLSLFSILAGPFFRLYMRILCKGTDVLQLSSVRLNSTLKDRFLREYRFFAGKVAEIPHPCDNAVERIDPSEAGRELGLLGKRVILLFGFIARNKGIEIALRAMEQIRELIPDAMMVIAGTPLDRDGVAYLHELHRLAKDLSLDQCVRFRTKFIPEEEVRLYFSCASVVVVPYTQSIGASGPIHNYAGYGVPIVASDAGHHAKESIGGNAVVFRHGDFADLASKVVQILTDAQLAERIREKQMAYARKETWELAAKRTLRIYQRVMSR